MARQPIQVEVILFRPAKDSYEYLLLKRIASRGGYWQPITGGLEEGEELRDAVVREVKEETGITSIKRIVDDVYEFSLEDSGRKEYVFGVEVKPDAVVSLDDNVYPEHDEYRWCYYEDAIKLLKWLGNKQGLINLDNILKK